MNWTDESEPEPQFFKQKGWVLPNTHNVQHPVSIRTVNVKPRSSTVWIHGWNYIESMCDILGEKDM